MEEELNTLRKLLVQSKTQHGHCRYFQKARGGLKNINKFVKNENDKSVSLSKGLMLLQQAACEFSKLLALGRFPSLCFVFIATIAKLLSILEPLRENMDKKEEKRRKKRPRELVEELRNQVPKKQKVKSVAKKQKKKKKKKKDAIDDIFDKLF